MSASASTPPAGQPRPNLIFFMCDDLGWGDLGCYGHSTIQTPNLDRFAQEGMLLTDCHAGSAVCSPSRAAMLTGRTPYRNGMYTIPCGGDFPFLRRSEITLARILRGAGYGTCHLGKWHLGSLKAESGHPLPHDHGFDHWLATPSKAVPSHLNPTNFIRNGNPTGEIQGNSSGILVEEAMDWLDRMHQANRPFFLNLWTHEPHTPIGTEARFRQGYDPALPPKVRDYYGNITQMDHAFGRLCTFLEERGLAENTWILFTSDNGAAWDPGFLDRVAASNGHHRGAKAWLYEGGIRVPGLVRWPGRIPAGSVSQAPVNGTDWFPTVLDLLGIPLPDDRVIDGTSLVPLFRTGRLPRPDRPIYWRYDGCDNPLKVAYREGPWVLLADSALDGCELYNLEQDWQQRHNRVYDADQWDRFVRMKAAMVAQHDSVEADGPDWWKQNPDPLLPWKRSAQGITRHLQGVIPEARPAPYPPERFPSGTVRPR